jgi:tRNA splicing ligase
MSKQTAVEWFEQQLDDLDIEIPFSIFEIAKEMEKEQIEEAFANGVDDEYEYHINNYPRTNSEQYYNETFNSDET